MTHSLQGADLTTGKPIRRKPKYARSKVIRKIHVRLENWEWMKQRDRGASSWIEMICESFQRRDEYLGMRNKYIQAMEKIRRLEGELLLLRAQLGITE
jgi:hypothetical protein